MFPTRARPCCTGGCCSAVARGGCRVRSRGAPLWWPGGKVAGEYLPRWLVEHGIVARAPEPEPEGIEVRRPVRELVPETRYLAELGREYRIADPAIKRLGRAMRDARSRL